MSWQRSEHLQAPPTDFPPKIPGSDTLRQAALQASWQRDKRVAQRRIAWRWVLWYLRKYSLVVVVGLVLLTGVAYLGGAFSGWAEDSIQAAAHPTAVAAPVLHRPSLVPTTTQPSLSEPVTDFSEHLDPLILRTSTLLAKRTAAPPSPPLSVATADTLTLKPETWLHSKEP